VKGTSISAAHSAGRLFPCTPTPAEDAACNSDAAYADRPFQRRVPDVPLVPPISYAAIAEKIIPDIFHGDARIVCTGTKLIETFVFV